MPGDKGASAAGDGADAWAARSQPWPGGEDSETLVQFPARLSPGSGLLQGPETKASVLTWSSC